MLRVEMESPPLWFYLEYLDYCFELKERTGHSLRTIDRALWQWSVRERSPSERSEDARNCNCLSIEATMSQELRAAAVAKKLASITLGFARIPLVWFLETKVRFVCRRRERWFDKACNHIGD